MGVLVRCGAMAAWLVVTGMAGVGVGYLLAVFVMGARLTRMDREVIEQYARPQHGDQAILERVLDRLLSAVIPEPQSQAPDEVETRGDAEYVPPDDDWTGAQDWTDPLLGGQGWDEERPLVGRLAPGQGIPGLPVQDGQVDPVEMWREKGEGAFDEWARETTTDTGWVQPIGEV